MEEEEEEEEGGGGGGDLFVFNDTIEGPRAPAVKPGIGRGGGGFIRIQWYYRAVKSGRVTQEEEEDLFVKAHH